MKHAITNVAKRQIDKIKEWEKNNPEWNKTEDGTNNYIKMVKMLTDCEDDKGDNKIIKTIDRKGDGCRAGAQVHRRRGVGGSRPPPARPHRRWWGPPRPSPKDQEIDLIPK